MKFLSDVMAEYSKFARFYKSLHEVVKEETIDGVLPNIAMYFDRTLQPGQDPNTYNLPTVDGQLNIPCGQGVISACYVREQDNTIPKNTFLIYPTHNPKEQQQRLYDNNANCEPMCYPLLFPCSEKGNIF